ncbi:hypothetical protein KKD03_03080 [Patescibacteria group bacterium]|nr:hypothetical protein [Patescibacteria group bacterium]
MKTRQRVFIGILFIILILIGINYFARPFEKYFDVKEMTVQKTIEPIEPVVLSSFDIVQKLSSKEKIAQMIATPLVIDEEITNESSKSATFSAVNLETGFFTIFGNNISFDSAKLKITEVERLYKDNLLSPKFAVDHEGGKVQRLNGDGFTVIPSWRKLCVNEDIEEFKKILKTSAQELRDVGIDIVLAPVLDVGNSQVLKDRICSDSYPVVAERSLEYIIVFDSYGILPVIKHFPGLGQVTKDLHTNFDFVKVLDNDVKLYTYIIGESPHVGVMISHAGVLNQNPEIPCSLSTDCVGELKNAYPELLIFSDALEMKSASFDKDNSDEEKDLLKVSREAVVAGNEVLIYGPTVTMQELENITNDLSITYDNDVVFKKLVDEAVLKIVNYKYTGSRI